MHFSSKRFAKYTIQQLRKDFPNDEACLWALIMCFAKRANNETKFSFPSYQTIADDCGWGRRKAIYVVDKLTEFFDRLRYIEGAVILIVFRLPSKSDFDDWVQIQEDYTKIQKCAYFREVIHTDRTSWVKIPKTSLLIPDNLNKLFE